MVNSITKWAATVATARYSPFSRSEGMPKTIPTAAVTRPASGITTGKGSPQRPAMMAVA